MRTGRDTIRSTQSFVGTLSECRRRPSLTGLEILWRWVFGIPALWLVVTRLRSVLGSATGGTFEWSRLGLDHALLSDPIGALTADPLGAVAKFSGAVSLLLPGISAFAIWAGPMLMLTWIVISSAGRTLVLRRANPSLAARPFTLMGLQAIRLTALAASFFLWFEMLRKASSLAIAGPIAAGSEPNLVLYSALVIVTTLGLFTCWAAVSWYFSIAPLVAMREGTGVIASLRASGRLGGLRGKLIEVNMVLGIVKIALIVLAMVFSATPLPFQTVTTNEFLAWWWAGVTVVYLVASDFFHVARLVGYLTLWRKWEPAKILS